VTELASPVIRVALVDDQELVRSGLGRILRLRNGFEIVAECSDGDEVERAVADTRPDVVVMDLRMKRVDGIEATRRLRAAGEDPPVLVLTTFDDDELLSSALRAGALGFLLKDAPAEDVIRAVKTIAAGDAWLDPSVTRRVLATYGRAPTPPPARHEVLTARELDVLRLLARGRSNGEIAGDLAISEVTVKSHIGHIFTKLGLRDRAAAIVYAFDSGVVGPAP
jgi:DNA-binding NarL/FixJ family response regulator